MTKGIGQSVFLASLTILLTNIFTKKRDYKSIIVPISVMIFSGIIYLYPNIFSFNIRVLFAIIIIFNALINILTIRKLNKISASLTYTEKKLKKELEQDEKSKEYDKGVILRKITKLLDPLGELIEKANKKVHLYIMLNNISILLGILLFLNDTITIVVCGIALLNTGLFDLLMFLRSVRLSRKNKEALKQVHKEYLKDRYEKEKKQD
jgi:dolichol kinase